MCPNFNSTTMSPNFGSISVLPSNTYGDPSVLTRLNSQLLIQRHLFLGDSQYVREFSDYLVPYATNFLWRGIETNFRNFDNATIINGLQTAKQLGNQGQLTQLVNEPGTFLSTLTQTTFLEQNVISNIPLIPGVDSERTCETVYFYIPQIQRLWNRFTNNNVACKILYKTFANGVTANNVAIQARINAANIAPNYVRSAFFNTKNAIPSWLIGKVILGPTANWNSQLSIENVFQGNQVPVIGETQEWDSFPWAELENVAGIMGHDQAVAGQSIDGYLDPNTSISWWSNGNFTNKVMVGEQVSLWLAIGTNGGDDYNTFLNKLNTVVTSFRNQYPNSDIILLTAHQNFYFNGNNVPPFALAMVDYAKANKTNKILCFDSWQALGSYQFFVNQGYMLDLVHFNPSGRIYEATILNAVLGK